MLPLTVLAAGCATTAAKQDLAPAPPSLSATEAATRIFSGDTPSTTPRENGVPGGDMLTLARVRAIAREHNPAFAEFAANRKAAAAEVLEAMAYPNPDFDVDLEPAVEFYVPIEAPGKRAARKHVAEAAAPIVDREEDAFRVSLDADVAKAYFTVLYYRHATDLAREAFAAERDIEGIVARRVENGEAPEMDRVKANVETLKAQRFVQQQQRLCDASRKALNAYCGRALPPDFALEDPLEGELAGVDADAAREIALAQHPALRRMDAALNRQNAIVQREKKAWFPDFRLGIPTGFELPLFHRNKGGVAAAEAERERLEAERERVRQEIVAGIEAGVETYESAREQVAAFRGGLREAAAEALRTETFMYQEGEVDLLHLLDARRTARQTDREYLQALYDAQTARVELERAIGVEGLER